MIKKYQPLIRCCSVMPQENNVSYEYVPEQAITKSEYESLREKIKNKINEDISIEHISCSTGGCPVVYKEELETV